MVTNRCFKENNIGCLLETGNKQPSTTTASLYEFGLKLLITAVNRGLCHFNVNTCCFRALSETCWEGNNSDLTWRYPANTHLCQFHVQNTVNNHEQLYILYYMTLISHLTHSMPAFMQVFRHYLTYKSSKPDLSSSSSNLNELYSSSFSPSSSSCGSWTCFVSCPCECQSYCSSFITTNKAGRLPLVHRSAQSEMFFSGFCQSLSVCAAG